MMTLAHPCNLSRAVKTSALSQGLEQAQCRARRNKHELKNVAADVIRKLVMFALSETVISEQWAKDALKVADNVERHL